MLWEDEENVVLDSGRKVKVPNGVIGLNMAGDTLYAGERPMMVVPDGSNASTALTNAEILDVARNELRKWTAFEKSISHAAMSRGKGKGKDSIDID